MLLRVRGVAGDEEDLGGGGVVRRGRLSVKVVVAAEASDDSPSYACSGVAAAGTSLWSPASDELRPNLAVPESVDDAISMWGGTIA